MDLLAAVVRWFANPANWQGVDGVPNRLLEHVQVSGAALLISLLVALPLGVWLGHTGQAGFMAVNAANIGRALPSMALLALALPVAFSFGLGLGFWPTLLALVPLGLPPIMTNAYVGIRGVDRDVVEAARGMGLNGRQVLWQVELPLALPLLVAGVRNAAVAIVATATLGALVAGGGLGRYIVDGLALQQQERLFVGALLVALLSIAVEAAFGLHLWLALSPGLRVNQATAPLGEGARPG